MIGSYQDGLGWVGWLLMALAMVGLWALVVSAVVALFTGTGATRRAHEDPFDERFARGGLDAVEEPPADTVKLP